MTQLSVHPPCPLPTTRQTAGWVVRALFHFGAALAQCPLARFFDRRPIPPLSQAPAATLHSPPRGRGSLSTVQPPSRPPTGCRCRARPTVHARQWGGVPGGGSHSTTVQSQTTGGGAQLGFCGAPHPQGLFWGNSGGWGWTRFWRGCRCDVLARAPSVARGRVAIKCPRRRVGISADVLLFPDDPPPEVPSAARRSPLLAAVTATAASVFTTSCRHRPF